MLCSVKPPLGSSIKGRPCRMTVSVVFLTTALHFSALCRGAEARAELDLKQEKRDGSAAQKKNAKRLRNGCFFMSILPASCERLAAPREEQTWKSFWVFTYYKEIAAVSKGKHVKANSLRGIAIGSERKNALESNVTDNPTRAGGVGPRCGDGFVSTSAWAIFASWQTGLSAAPGQRAFAAAKFLRPLLRLLSLGSHWFTWSSKSWPGQGIGGGFFPLENNCIEYCAVPQTTFQCSNITRGA